MYLHNSEASLKTFFIRLELSPIFSKELELFTISLTRIISKINNLSFFPSISHIGQALPVLPGVAWTMRYRERRQVQALPEG